VVHFVVVEDDHLQEERITEHLRGAFEGAHVLALSTEEEFRAQLPGMRADVPDLVLVDVMLRWTDPRPGMPGTRPSTHRRLGVPAPERYEA